MLQAASYGFAKLAGRARSELNGWLLCVILIDFSVCDESSLRSHCKNSQKPKQHSTAERAPTAAMDFLDYEEETEINESDSPHQSITKLLDNRELLQELRATPSIASFLKNPCTH